MGHDEWWTATDVYDDLCERFIIVPNLDVCAKNRDAAKVKDNFITPEQNMFEVDWSKQKLNDQEVVWFMNPPNSMLKQCLKRALTMWQEHNIAGLIIIPTSTISRQHFRPIWDLIESGVIKIGRDFKPLFGRPNFLENGKLGEYSNRNDYIGLVFRKRNTA